MTQTLKLVEKAWIKDIQYNKKNARIKPSGIFCFSFLAKNISTLNKVLAEYLESWQLQKLKSSKRSLELFHAEKGDVLVFRAYLLEAEKQISFIKSNHKGALSPSRYGWLRDAMGTLFLKTQSYTEVDFRIFDGKTTDIQALLIGLELAHYGFKKIQKNERSKFYIRKDKGIVTQKEIDKAAALSVGVNLSRHLVNLPANILNPKSYSLWVKSHFQKYPHMKVEVWDEKKIKKENMGLLLAVGDGASHPPSMVKISYTPKGKISSSPLVFVGKGVTFDSGGLNLKPTGAIRNMKKDMGGSASVVGLAHWVAETKPNKALDFYIGLCENAVSHNSFRPGDVITSRSGLQIEIDNTDAEGRLVLADVIDVVLDQKVKPKAIIDLATLTGAIKAALGTDVAGYFTNDDGLSQHMEKAVKLMAEPTWRMPLFQNYRPKFSSSVATMTNSVNGFGGAMNAALFLETFVKGTPWLHVDIYAWTDAPQGCYLETGGNGQMVQVFSEFIQQM